MLFVGWVPIEIFSTANIEWISAIKMNINPVIRFIIFLYFNGRKDWYYWISESSNNYSYDRVYNNVSWFFLFLIISNWCNHSNSSPSNPYNSENSCNSYRILYYRNYESRRGRKIYSSTWLLDGWDFISSIEVWSRESKNEEEKFSNHIIFLRQEWRQ